MSLAPVAAALVIHRADADKRLQQNGLPAVASSRSLPPTSRAAGVALRLPELTLRRAVNHGVGVVDTHAVRAAVFQYQLHDRFVSLFVRPVALEF